METNKKGINNLKKSKELNENMKKCIKPISLYSSISNLYINERQVNLIPLSLLFKTKLNNANQNKNKIDTSKKYNSLGKIPLNKSQRNYANLISNYKSFCTQKFSSIKLPRIKNGNNNSNRNNELRDSLVDIIFNKFEQYDNKFREQEKISVYMIKRGDVYLKLKKDHIKDDDIYKYSASKFNYKKQYSKLFTRIKNIQLI